MRRHNDKGGEEGKLDGSTLLRMYHEFVKALADFEHRPFRARIYMFQELFKQ